MVSITQKVSQMKKEEKSRKENDNKLMEGKKGLKKKKERTLVEIRTGDLSLRSVNADRSPTFKTRERCYYTKNK